MMPLRFSAAGSDKSAETDGRLIDLLSRWSFVYYYRGRYKELLSLLTDHQALAESLPDRNKCGMFYAWMGCALWHRERFQEAHQHLLKALAIGEDINDAAVVGYACCWLSWVCTELGLLDDAIGLCRKSPKDIRNRQRRDDYIYVSSMAGMGYALWHRGDKDKTLDVGNVLLDFGRKQDDYRAKGMGYCCIGWSHLIGGDLAQATPYFEKAVQVSIDPWYSLFPKLALAYGFDAEWRFSRSRKLYYRNSKVQSAIRRRICRYARPIFSWDDFGQPGQDNRGASDSRRQLSILAPKRQQTALCRLRLDAGGGICRSCQESVVQESIEICTARLRQSQRLFSERD